VTSMSSRSVQFRPKAFDKRCSALEEKAWPAVRQSMIKGIEGPTDPEVFLNIAGRRSKPIGVVRNKSSDREAAKR